MKLDDFRQENNRSSRVSKLLAAHIALRFASVFLTFTSSKTSAPHSGNFLSHARSTRRKASQAFPLLALCVANHVVDIVSILRRKPLRILNVPSSSSSTSSSLLRIAFEPASDSGWLSFSLTLFFTALWIWQAKRKRKREEKSENMYIFHRFRFLRACFSLFYSDYDCSFQMGPLTLMKMHNLD